MHQTTYGETHKVRIYDSDRIKEFLEKNNKALQDLNLENCIYQNKKIISSKALNFLNLQEFSPLENQLKFLIRSAYDESEKEFPYLGDIFIENFFDSSLNGTYETFKFSKKYEDKFINTLENKIVQDIASWFFSNSSLERLVTVEKTHLDEVVIESNDEMSFSIKYDTDYLAGKFYHEMENYKLVIIDGFIESVGELHHFLHSAAETKIPHVIFCFGMSDEVKHTIITNNGKGITEIFPVVMSLDSETANILNDFAILHNANVISALMGQTISQAVRNDLQSGNKIIFFKDKIIVSPLCDQIAIVNHRKFLLKRINEAPPETDTKPIINRLKNFSSKSTKIYIPNDLYRDIFFLRELHYFLSFLNSLSLEFVEYRNRMFPFNSFANIQKKINSLSNTYHNIDKAVILSRRD